MRPEPSIPFERFAAEQLLEQRVTLSRAWMEGIRGELHLCPRRAIPTDALLDAFPAVLARVAEFLCSDDERALCADSEVLDTLRALAGHKQRQGHDVQELIRELHLLSRILDSACLRWLDRYPGVPPSAAVVRVSGRLNRAPILLGEIGAGAFLELERAERVRLAEQTRTFADLLVHELKTPLSAAELAAVILEDDEMIATAQERRRFATLIQRSLRQASVVVDDARRMVSTAGEEAEGRWLPIGQVLAAVLAEMGDRARTEGVVLEVREPIPDLRVDASRLERILLNLIGNAIKYSDPSKADRWIRVRFERGGEGAGGWAVEVSDNGLGIPAEHHPHVFSRSFRSHPERAGGTGLGLTIVREAVCQLGGAIHLESEPCRGSTFRISFPAPAGEQVTQ